MSKILNFKDFVVTNEKKKEFSTIEYIVEDIETILDFMFAESKNLLYKIKDKFVKSDAVIKAGEFPTEIKFNVDKKDFNVKYEKPINNDYTRNVLAKREYDVTLEFKDKEEVDKDAEIFTMYFKVKLDKVDEERLSKAKLKDNDDDDDNDVKDDEHLDNF